MTNEIDVDQPPDNAERMHDVAEALADARATIKGATVKADYIAEAVQVAEGLSATKRERVYNAVDRAAFELGVLLHAAECAAKWVRAACETLDAEGVR